eukprot:Ihof_evm1s1198 gene=Ihof_evmTU1s1198
MTTAERQREFLAKLYAENTQEKKKTMLSTAYYITAVLIATLGASVAAIPLYRVFCSATGFAGTTQHKE